MAVKINPSGWIDIEKRAAPGIPSTNVARLYAADSNGITLLHVKESNGSVSVFGGGVKTVVDDIDGKTLTAADAGTVQTNAGAQGAAAWVLPAAVAGLTFTFIVMVAQELRVTPATGDVINIAGVAASAAEYWTANAVGEALVLVAVDATNWIATSFTGTWTQQTP